MFLRVVFAALILLAAVPAVALSAPQAGAGTGWIVGTVTDEAGRPMAGAEVSISGRALMTPQKTTSGEAGAYRLVTLPPGDYRVTVSATGFATAEHDVQVGLGVTLTINVTLTIAKREVVTVQGTLDHHSATISQLFDSRLIGNLPGSRNLGSLFANAHAVTTAVFEVGGGTGIIAGGYSAYGKSSTPRQTIEGIVVTGLFGAGFTPDYGSLDEVSIITAATGAEWPTPGVHTDIVTKSGSNSYRGTIYAAGEDRRVQASNVDADQISRGAIAGVALQPDQANQLWRNSDFNADIGGYVLKDRLWWYGSARYQDVATRLVNFPAGPYVTSVSNYSGKATWQLTPGHTLVFYAQRGVNDQPYRLEPFGPAGSELSATSAFNATSESTADQHNASWLWKGEWTGVIGNAVAFEMRAGQFGSNQQWSSRSAAPRFEDIETLEVSGGNRDWASTSRRNQASGAATYFVQNRSGRHYLRFGGEAMRFLVTERWWSGYPGNVVHVLRGGQPLSVYLFGAPSLSEGGVLTFSGWASDAWQPHSRLTLTLGVRFDHHQLFLPAQSHSDGTAETQFFAAVPNLVDWNEFTPRFSAVFDTTGRGQTLLKGSFGRYVGAPNAAQAFNANPNSSPWWSQYDWGDPNGSGVWEPGEEGRLQRSRGGLALESIDPNLSLARFDETGAWLEQLLPGGFSIRTGGIWRIERSPYARQNVNQPFDAFTVSVPIRDRGIDGVEGTADDGPMVTAYDLDPSALGQPAVNVVRNVPGAPSEWITWEIAATRRLQGRWTFGGGLTYTWNREHAANYSGQAVRNNVYPLTPNDFINTGSGGRHEFATWTFKAHGTYEFPWQVRATPVLRHQSGQPYGRTQTTERGQLRYGTVTILMEPIGTRRMDNVTLVDLRIDKTIRVKDGRVVLFLDVFNLCNANPEQNVVWSSGSSFLRPLTIVPPRIARLGITFDW